MIVTLCTERIRTLDDIRAFLGGNEAADTLPLEGPPAWASRWAARALSSRRTAEGRPRVLRISKKEAGLEAGLPTPSCSDALRTRFGASTRAGRRGAFDSQAASGRHLGSEGARNAATGP